MRVLRPLAAVVAAVVVLAGMAYAGYRVWLERQPPGDRLTLYGNVEIREVELAFNVGGRIDRMLYEEGDRVQKGMLVAMLDRDRFEDEVDAAAAQRDRQAARLAELEAGSRPEEIARAEAAVAEARARVANAIARFERQQRLANEAFASQQALDNARAERDRARAQLRIAEEELQLARKGPREEAIEAAGAELNALKAQLAIARERLEDTELYAPDDGTILTRVHEPGAIVTTGETVYTLSLIDPVWVRAYVSEPNLGRIEPGMPAKVYTDARPEEPYPGHVGFVSPTAEFTPKTVQTPEMRTSLVYRLRVVVRNPDGGLRQGMPVTVEIPLARQGGPAERPEAGMR